MNISSSIRRCDIKVLSNIAAFGKRSLRKIAEATGISKDRVSRSLQRVNQRDQYAESHLWETEEGQEWLRRLVIAMLYEFGMKGNQGAERMSKFLKHIRVNTHVGVSPTALRHMMKLLEEHLVTYQRAQEALHRDTEQEIVAAGDETWLGDKMLLVLMDLSSGYLVMEDEAEDRCHETWAVKSQARLEEKGFKVKHFVSDRAKALIKLATSSFGTLAGADIFHAQYDISKWLGRSLSSQKGRAWKHMKDAEDKKVK